MYRGRELDPVRHTELGEHAPEVGVHGVRRDVHAPADGDVVEFRFNV